MNLFFELPNHSAYKITGADRERYLQGRLTQDIKTIKSSSCLLLNPQGKILAKILLSKETDCYILITDPCDDFVINLLKFKVADDISAEKLNYSIFSILGELDTNYKKLASHRTTQKNFDILVPIEERDNFIAELKAKNFNQGNEELRAYLRIESFIPEFGADMDSSTSATEIPYRDLISFKKGCYAGQEVVEMSIARGKPNKLLVALKAKQNIIGKEIYSTEDKNQSCGYIQTIACFENRYLAFAYIKNAYSNQSYYYNNEQKLELIKEKAA